MSQSQIRFRADAQEFHKALAAVSVVPPRPIHDETSAGYLFRVSDNGTTCTLYSRDKVHASRATFPITDLEGSGSFAYPSAHASGFSFFKSGDILFEATEDGGTFRVNAVSPSRKGMSAWRTSFDHKHLRSCDKEFEAAKLSTTQVFSSAALRHALSLAVAFRPEAKSTGADDSKYTAQIFDKNYETDELKEGSATGVKLRPYEGGDGFLFAHNGIQALYYYSDEFKGKSLSVHFDHIDLFQQYLSKSTGNVSVYQGPKMVFVENSDGHVLGWNHVGKLHARFKYLGLNEDHFVLLVSPNEAADALEYLKTQVEGDEDKIRIQYSGDTLIFEVADDSSKAKGVRSWEIPVTSVKAPRTEFTTSASVKAMLKILKPLPGSASNQIELRVTFYEAGKRQRALLRTIDPGVELEKGSTSKTVVTRFAPSFD